MRILIKIIILSVTFGAVSGTLTAFAVLNFKSQNQNNLIESFYLTENAVHISPHHIRKAMDNGDKSFILVDLRSQEEYEKEHIIGAISVPAYKDPNTSAYDDVGRILTEFSKLPKDKEIVIYCYSMSCMTGRKVGKLLVENGIYVKHLGIGWNEWRYFWNLWNHEGEWDLVSVEDYIAIGKEPGVPGINENSSVCLPGELDC